MKFHDHEFFLKNILKIFYDWFGINFAIFLILQYSVIIIIDQT